MMGHSSNRLLLPKTQAPRFRACQPSARLPGGTFPNKYARAASLAGKHGLPQLPPALLPSSLPALLSGDSVGPAWPRSEGHFGPNSILESQD